MLKVFLFVFLFLVVKLGASPIGNSATPGLVNSGIFSMANPWIKLTSGYLADYVSDLRFELSSGKAEFDPKETFTRYGLHSQMASVSLILLERVEAFALLGGSKEHLKWHEEPKTSLFSTMFDLQTTYHFSWGAGLRVILLQWGQTFFNMDASYFTVPTSHHAFFRFLNRLSLPIYETEQRFSLEEWQGGISLASCFWILTPYAGMNYLHAKLCIQEGPESSSLIYKNRKTIGYYYGATLSLTSKFMLTFERRVRNEFAYTLSTQAVF